MVASYIQRLTSIALWGTLCVFFSLFISSGALLLGAIILVILFAVIAVMLGPQFIAAAWLIGSPTVFGFPNQILRALPVVTMERLLLGTLMVMVFLQYAFSKRRTQWLSLEKAILFFLAYAFISLLLHTDKFNLRQDGWLWIQFFMPLTSFILSRRIKWSDKGLKTLLALLTLTGVFLAFVGMLQSLFGIDVFTMNYQTIALGSTDRAYGTFSNAHTYAASMYIFLTVSLLQYVFCKDKLLRFGFIVAMGVIAIGIVLGETRAPWLGAALGFAIIFIKHPQSRPLMLVGGITAFTAGIVFVAIMIDQLDSFFGRVMDFGTLAGRATNWATARNMIIDNPLFGLGFGEGTYLLNKAEYFSGFGSYSAQHGAQLGIPHNQYLHVAVMLGLSGLILFLVILVQLIRLMFRIFYSDQNNQIRRYLALYTGTILIALMLNSFFADTYVLDYFWVLAFFLAGIAAGNLDEVPANNVSSETGGRHEDPVGE